MMIGLRLHSQNLPTPRFQALLTKLEELENNGVMKSDDFIKGYYTERLDGNGRSLEAVTIKKLLRQSKPLLLKTVDGVGKTTFLNKIAFDLKALQIPCHSLTGLIENKDLEEIKALLEKSPAQKPVVIIWDEFFFPMALNQFSELKALLNNKRIKVLASMVDGQYEELQQSLPCIDDLFTNKRQFFSLSPPSVKELSQMLKNALAYCKFEISEQASLAFCGKAAIQNLPEANKIRGCLKAIRSTFQTQYPNYQDSDTHEVLSSDFLNSIEDRAFDFREA